MADNGKPKGMQVWHFSEMAYHPAWPQLGESYRVVIPSGLYDPKIGAAHPNLVER